MAPAQTSMYHHLQLLQQANIEVVMVDTDKVVGVLVQLVDGQSFSKCLSYIVVQI